MYQLTSTLISYRAERKKKSFDGGNKRATILDSDNEDLALKKSEKSSGIDDDSDNDKKGPNSKKVQIAKERNFFPCQNIISGPFRKDFCKRPKNSFMLSLSNIFHGG